MGNRPRADRRVQASKRLDFTNYRIKNSKLRGRQHHRRQEMPSASLLAPARRQSRKLLFGDLKLGFDRGEVRCAPDPVGMIGISELFHEGGGRDTQMGQQISIKGSERED
jgi:hypothetical protein